MLEIIAIGKKFEDLSDVKIPADDPYKSVKDMFAGYILMGLDLSQKRMEEEEENND